MRMRRWGRFGGQDIVEAVLQSDRAEVAILNYGGVIRDWRVAGPGGGTIPAVLGFPTFEPYPDHSKSFGIIAGRVANRIAGAQFALGGRVHRLTRNLGAHHLHGGAVGLGRRVWMMEPDGETLHLAYISPDGEEGYPGRVRFRVSYALDGARLTIRMAGDPDRPTPINLANHNYYNLDGAGPILDHRLRVAADGVTETDDALIPTGRILPVAGTRWDFRIPRRIGDADPERAGHDGNLVLETGRDSAAPAAVLVSERSGLAVRLVTDQPGMQLFTAATLDCPVPGHDGARMGPFTGVALEPQHFPDAVNQPGFPSIIATPDAPYRQRLEITIAPA